MKRWHFCPEMGLLSLLVIEVITIACVWPF